jgi:hypothetical protein
MATICELQEQDLLQVTHQAALIRTIYHRLDRSFSRIDFKTGHVLMFSGIV